MTKQRLSVEDPYKSPDIALSEIKGWLEGVKVKLDVQLKALEAL